LLSSSSSAPSFAPHVDDHLPAILRPKSIPGKLPRGLLELLDFFPNRIHAAPPPFGRRAAAERAAASARTPPDLPGRRPSPLTRALGPPCLPGAQAARPRHRPARARPERGRRRASCPAPPRAAAPCPAPPYARACACLAALPPAAWGLGPAAAAPPVSLAGGERRRGLPS